MEMKEFVENQFCEKSGAKLLPVTMKLTNALLPDKSFRDVKMFGRRKVIFPN